MIYRIMEQITIGPGLLCAKDAGPISSIPFASMKDAKQAAIAYGGEEALKKGVLVIMEDDGEDGIEVWELSNHK